MSDLDVLRHSVTRNDRQVAPGGVFFLNTFGGYGAEEFPIPPTPPRYWTPERDYILRTAALDTEDMYVSALSKAISKMAAHSWTIDDSAGGAQRIKRSQEQFLFADGGQGWITFLSKHLEDYCCADNGAPIETIRATRAAASRVIGFAHLDTLRTRRTGDPERPAIYTDLKGHEHILEAHQVTFITDMPSARASLFGVGRCATSRAYRSIYKVAAIARYFAEKITGRGTNAVHFVDGITDKQLEDAFAGAEAGKIRQGIRVYKGQIFITSMKGVQAVNTVDLAGIADGFDVKQQLENAYLVYAQAIGMPPPDVQPLTSQGLGGGIQTQILDDAAEGQGLARWMKDFEHWASHQQLPTTTVYIWSADDTRDKKAKAEVAKMHADTHDVMIANGTISAPEARQLAVDAGDLPPEFVVTDETAGGQLSDNEKPVDAEAVIPLPEPIVEPEAAVATKTVDYPKALDWLIERLGAAIDEDTTALESEQTTVDDWRNGVERLLKRYTAAAWKAGQGGAQIEKADVAKINGLVSAQVDFLNNFTVEIQEGAAWDRGWNARAAMYAQSIKQPYWQAFTKVLPLPAMPAEGTDCLVNCRCSWEIDTLDAEAGDYNATWRRGATDSCQTCIERATQWSPLQIRGGVLL